MTTPCNQATFVGAYHDGELAPEARDEFEAHVRTCPLCAAELERLRQLTTLLRQGPAPEADQQVLQRLHHLADSLPTGRAVMRLAEALAAVAAGIVVICAVSLSQGGPVRADGAPAWETNALTPPTTETAHVASEDAVAEWVLSDLSRKD